MVEQMYKREACGQHNRRKKGLPHRDGNINTALNGSPKSRLINL